MRRPGLTLVELVITISLTAILGIPAGILFSEHLTAALRARDAAVAMSLARYEMERLDGLNDFFASGLTVATTNPIPTPPWPSGYPSYSGARTVTCFQTMCPGCSGGQTTACSACSSSAVSACQMVKQIRVTVGKSGTRLAELRTYRTRNVGFGQ